MEARRVPGVVGLVGAVIGKWDRVGNLGRKDGDGHVHVQALQRTHHVVIEIGDCATQRTALDATIAAADHQHVIDEVDLRIGLEGQTVGVSLAEQDR